MRLSIYGLLLTAAVALSSCADKLSEDEILIENIKNATNRQAVERPDLPTPCRDLLDYEHIGEALTNGWFANGLGYELRIGDRCDRYFDLDGRELQDRRRRRPGRPGNRCFQPVFPLDITFDGGDPITINSHQDLREAHAEHCDDWTPGQRCFDLVFPVTVQLQDGSTVTVNGGDDLRELHENCDRG